MVNLLLTHVKITKPCQNAGLANRTSKQHTIDKVSPLFVVFVKLVDGDFWGAGGSVESTGV